MTSESSSASSSTVEEIMRRAEEMGLSPQRVARALEYTPPPPPELQHTMELARPSLLARLFGRTSGA